MTDIFTTTRRSEIMRSIKNKNTKPELLLRRSLHKLGLRFRLHDKKLPGTPDIVLKKYKTVIFVNGCFWHGHLTCKRGTTPPKTRTDYWLKKIEGNKERDKRKINELNALGWNVIVIFECDLKSQKLESTLDVLANIIQLKG